MNKQKPAPGGGANKKAEDSLVRSSAAKYLTFVAASGQGGVEAVYVDENVWLSQKMMGVLYDVETHTVNYHRKKIFDDAELEAGSVIRNFRITAADGKSYDTRHYNLSAILAVGYQVNSERVVQFRGELFYGTQILVCFLFLAKIKAAGKCRAVPELELALAA